MYTNTVQRPVAHKEATNGDGTPNKRFLSPERPSPPSLARKAGGVGLVGDSHDGAFLKKIGFTWVL